MTDCIFSERASPMMLRAPKPAARIPSGSARTNDIFVFDILRDPTAYDIIFEIIIGISFVSKNF